MSGIGDRISLIIQSKRMKKVEFARRLGIDGSYVTHLVKGKNPPSDALVKLICREFHIREEWLLTGEGPMEDTEPMTPLTEYVQERGMTPFEERLIHAWFDLPLDTRQMLMDHFRKRLADGGDLLAGLDAFAGGNSAVPAMAPVEEDAEETAEEVPYRTEEEIQEKLAAYEALLRGEQRMRRQYKTERLLLGNDSETWIDPNVTGGKASSGSAG